MTKDDIIRMAKEAGLISIDNGSSFLFVAQECELTKFASLIVAHEMRVARAAQKHKPMQGEGK